MNPSIKKTVEKLRELRRQAGYEPNAWYEQEEEKALQDTYLQSRKDVIVTEDTSDGYHTFKELYEFRKVYNAVLFNEWVSQGKYNIHKSKRHSDGEECFGGGWFIVSAKLPTGQISNHYELKDWDLFKCEERERAEEWDGHTAHDVLTRLQSLQDSEEII